MTEQELMIKVANDIDWVKKICSECKALNTESHNDILREIQILHTTAAMNKSTINYIKVAVAGLFTAFLAFGMWITEKVIR